MIIEKIVIKSFGLITDMTLEFSSSVNVIEGENESGKSTIAAFIRYMLYGFDNTSREGELSEREKRINWQTGMAQGSMYVSVKGKRYLITRTTIPNENSATNRVSYKEEAVIMDLETGTPAFGKMPAGEVFFGVDSELFDNTAFIGQINDSGINEGSVKESIENILFSGSEKVNTKKAEARINDRMEALLHTGGTGGVICDLMRKCDEYKEKIEKSNEDNKRILEKEAELYEVKSARDRAISDREHFREIDSCYNNMMVIQSFDRLHEFEEEADRCAEAYNSYVAENTRGGFAPDEDYLTELAICRELVNTDYQRLGEAERTLEEQKRVAGITHESEMLISKCDERGGEDKLLKNARSLFGGVVKFMSLFALGILVAVFAVVFEIVAIRDSVGALWKALAGVAGGLGVVSSAVSIVYGLKALKGLKELEGDFDTSKYGDLTGKIKHIASVRAQRDNTLCATELARNSVNTAKASYELSKNRLSDAVSKWADEPAADDLDGYLDRLEEKVRQFIEEKNRLLSEKNNTELTVKEIRRTLADKSEIDIRAQVSPLKRKALSGINHEHIINGIVENKAKIAEQDELATRIESELYELKSNAGDIGDYYAKLDCLEARTAELNTRHKAYFIASEAISGAMEKLREEISPRIAEYATNMMSKMTGGKYTSFTVDDGLKVSFVGKDGENKSVDFLSGGTKSLTYVAVRCALIDMLYHEKPPICFDESFAHQDNVRARAMMQAIKQLSEENCQSFIFTCRNRESTLAREIIKDAGIYKLSVVSPDND